MPRFALLAVFTVLATAGCSVAAATPVTTPAPSAAVVSRCHTADLKASLGIVTGSADTQNHVPLTFTNTGKTACRMYGFPGVDLVGADLEPWGPTFSLRRTTDKPATVVLPAGGSASAIIAFLRANPGDPAWVPEKLVTIPPDETAPLTVPWPKLSVMRQDGATRPGTYVGAIGAKEVTMTSPASTRR